MILASIFRGTFGVAYFIGAGLLLLAHIAAATVALVDLWGWSAPIAGIASIAAVIFLGPIGYIASAILGYIGATQSWGWEWWQAILLVAPGFAFLIISWIGGGLFAMATSIFERGGSD